MRPAFSAFFCAVLLTAGWVRPASGQSDPDAYRVLVFSKTAGFRHASIADGVAAVRALGGESGFGVDATEDAAVFSDTLLARYAAVVFLNTTGDVLGAEQQAAFERFIRQGGGFVGVHSASDTEYGWAWYGGLVGAYFASHPEIQAATVKVLDRVHPSTAHLPARWPRTDEWYDFRAQPRGNVHVLAVVDETTYGGGTMGHDHPIAWCHDYEGGRSWYTAGGHTAASYAEPLFREHLRQGIRYAAGAVPGDCSASIGNRIEKTVLEDDTVNPMDLAVADDGRVLWAERGGRLRLWRPEGTSTTVAEFDVSTAYENGLLGVALDPGFAENGWVYLYYSPRTGPPRQQLSRLTLVGEVLDRLSEHILLTVPLEEGGGGHAGGSLAFDEAGDLYVGVGDDTNPFASDGYAPIDERPGRAPYDAQRSSANTQDLRGKILRIHPEADGTYSVPAGNLFADPAAGRPEIYVMGVRNPFRLTVDDGWLYWGDVGPDARSAAAGRGPAGLDEWNRTRAAGHFGWPYCIGPNRPYVDFDFATGRSGPAFDCDAPINDSPNNTGAASLPPSRPAWVWYPYGASPEFPGIRPADMRAAMAGPVYHYDPDLDSDYKLPEYYDGALFMFDWTRDWIHEVRFDDAGELLAILPFAPEVRLAKPISLKAGPDGALYVLEWGSGYEGSNADARLARIVFARGTRSPLAVAEARPTSGLAPLTVRFSAAGSYDPDPGDQLSFSWDFEDDGIADAAGIEVEHQYTESGRYVARMTVSDMAGNTATTTLPITVGNHAPVVTIEAPADGGFFEWNADIPFRVGVADAEDGATSEGTIACEQVHVAVFVGHDDHAHPHQTFDACEGAFRTVEGHGADGSNLFYTFEVSYTDRGVGGDLSVTTQKTHVLHPKRMEAEHFTAQAGVRVEEGGDVAGGGAHLGFLDDGDYVAYERVYLGGMQFVTFRVASDGAGGRIELRAGSPDGLLLGQAYVEPTGSWAAFREVTAPVSPAPGAFTLYLVFRGPAPGATGLFNLNWFTFIGTGVGVAPAEPYGLAATYFDRPDLTGRSVHRIDPRINFHWAGDAPLFPLPDDGFSVRWTGQLVAPKTEKYTFAARFDDGIRVWFDGRLAIDRWADQTGPVEVTSLPMRLEEGRRYDLKVEYYERTGGAQAHLSWSSPSTPWEVVPVAVLRAGAGTGTHAGSQPYPQRLALGAAFPDPFADRTAFTVRVHMPGRVRVEVLDVLGRRVQTLLDDDVAAGEYPLAWAPSGMASGVYFLRLVAPEGVRSRRVVLLK